MDEYPVKVYIYDISKGLARSMSLPLIGRQIDGVWHTGVVVHGEEFYFGGVGIGSCPPAGTILGRPDQIVDLGNTQVPSEVWMDYLEELSRTTFSSECYHLLDHNCNTFSNEAAQFLTGRGIPEHITSLPQDVMSTPFGQMMRPFVDAMSVNPGGGQALFSDASSLPHHAAPAAVPQTGGQSDSSSSRGAAAASSLLATSPADAHTAAGRAAAEMKLVRFEDVQVLQRFRQQASSLESVIPAAQLSILHEVVEYASTQDCTWSLSREHIKCIGAVLQNESISTQQRALVAGLVPVITAKQEVVGMLKFDAERTYLRMLCKSEHQSAEIQEPLGKSVCNCCTCEVGTQWLLQTEELQLDSQQVSCSSLVCRLCTHYLLHDCSSLQTTGAALALNLTHSSQTPEELAVEVGSALIELSSKDLDEITAQYTLYALLRCMKKSVQITGLAKVMGLDVDRIAARHPAMQHVCQQIKTQTQDFEV